MMRDVRTVQLYRHYEYREPSVGRDVGEIIGWAVCAFVWFVVGWLILL